MPRYPPGSARHFASRALAGEHVHAHLRMTLMRSGTIWYEMRVS